MVLRTYKNIDIILKSHLAKGKRNIVLEDVRKFGGEGAGSGCGGIEVCDEESTSKFTLVVCCDDEITLKRTLP